jgi:hypothetical protein
MKITNLHNLPQAIVDRIEKDVNENPYGDSELKQFRTTQLIGPPLPHTLSEKHDDEIVVDATDFMALIFGTVLHELCEGPDTDEKMHEMIVGKSFTVDGVEYQLNGTVDEVEFDGTEDILVTDNKTCLLRNLGYDKPEYNMQLNIYKHMLEDTFKGAKFKLFIRYFIKDWTSGDLKKALERAQDDFAIWGKGNKTATKCFDTYEAAQAHFPTMTAKMQAKCTIIPRNKSSQRASIRREFPESPIHYKEVPVMPAEEIEAFIKERIKVHVNEPDQICGPENRWNNDIRCKSFCRPMKFCKYAIEKGYAK